MTSQKKCTVCKRTRLVRFFGNHKKKHDGLQSACRDCNAKRSKAYYERNKNLHREVTRRNTKRYRNRNRRVVIEHLFDHPCVDCGEVEVLLLEFDHVRGKKSKNISDMIGYPSSVEALMTEIAKCDVRCLVCHRRKTAKENRWWIIKWAEDKDP